MAHQAPGCQRDWGPFFSCHGTPEPCLGVNRVNRIDDKWGTVTY